MADKIVNLRNFWVEVNVEGRKEKLATGPRSKDGTMRITLYQRDKGTKRTAFELICEPDGDDLCTSVYVDGKWNGRFETER